MNERRMPGVIHKRHDTYMGRERSAEIHERRKVREDGMGGTMRCAKVLDRREVGGTDPSHPWERRGVQ